MAKRRKSSKKRSKCPEPLNTLIDVAAGITMHAIADKMEKKHNYHKRGAPNPYRASAYGFTAGKMRTTEDILKLGAVMGAMGSFDDDYVPPEQCQYHPDTSWEFDDIGNNCSHSNDNKYAWRLNCEDGSDYGIYPEDYETRDEYNEALSDAKFTFDEGTENDDEPDIIGINPTFQEPEDEYIFCRVSRMDNGKNEYFLSDREDIKIGEIINIPANDGVTSGVVLSVEHHTRRTAPQPPEYTKHIKMSSKDI